MKSQALSFIIHRVRPHLFLLSIGMIGLVGGAGVNMLIPELVRNLVDPSWFTFLTERPLLSGALAVGVFAVQGIFFYIRTLCFGLVGQQSVTQLREEIAAAILEKDITFFDKNSTGDLISRFNSDCVLVRDAISIHISVLLRYSFQVAIGVILMVRLSPFLSLTIVLTIPILVGLSILLGRRLRFLTKSQQQALGITTDLAQESFDHIRVVRAFNQEKFQLHRIAEGLAKTLQIGVARTRVAAFFSSFVSFLMNGAIVVVMLLGVLLVAHKQMEVGNLTAFLLYGVIVAVSFAFLAGNYGEFQQALGGAERLQELLVGAVTPKPDAPLEQLASKGVTFENVSFAYPARPDLRVLDDISFSMAPGTMTALVGPSGAGKSTIVQLLLGLYDLNAGEINIFGHSLRKYSAASLRRSFAYVPQDAELFGMSLAENIRLGNEAATDDEVRAALKSAQLLDFAESLPLGINTQVGSRGTQLSGGQKQRVAIARALIRKPKLLILDEATSALDSESEHFIQQALSSGLKDRITLVIAHRLATVQHADQVLVMSRGKIVERGNHSALIASGGLYRDLVERQELKSA